MKKQGIEKIRCAETSSQYLRMGGTGTLFYRSATHPSGGFPMPTGAQAAPEVSVASPLPWVKMPGYFVCSRGLC